MKDSLCSPKIVRQKRECGAPIMVNSAALSEMRSVWLNFLGQAIAGRAVTKSSLHRRPFGAPGSKIRE
jgi:hypothetical protein